MNVLTTRALSYSDENGDKRELILTVFVPFQAKEYQWKCEFLFGPPINGKANHGVGADFIQAFVLCLHYARAYLGTWDVGRGAHWQEMLDCGLPETATRPAALGPADIPPPEGSAGNMDVLATREVGYRDEGGIERELLLTVFVPFKADDDMWKCGFTFDPPPSMSIRYGIGADFIEALLDSLAKARATFEGTAPKGWKPSEEGFACGDLPYKIGRSFWTDPAHESPPVADRL